MVVSFESIFIVVIFLRLNTARNMLPHTGNEILNMHSQKVSNAQEHTALQWPKGIVTYYLDNITYDDYVAQSIRMAMNVLESASCVRFKPTLIKPAGNITWIHFTNPQGERNCVHESKLKNNGEIVLVLGFDCLKEHEILHTLLHAIGFKDEVSHPQRDQYIRVMWNNIQPEYWYLYRIRSSVEDTYQLLVEYDPLSIMHFHDRAFSMNGHATVMPLVPGLLINPSENLSQLDKMRLRLLFDHECNKRKVGDMIDTCKVLLSTNARPSDDSKNVTDSKLEKVQDKPDEVDKISEVGEIGDVDKVDDVDKNDGIDKVTKIDENEDQNETTLKSIENQNDLNEQNPDKALNRLIPIKIFNDLLPIKILNDLLPIKFLNHKVQKKEAAESVSGQDDDDIQKSEYENED